MIDLKCSAYLYAQKLDNSGDAHYLCFDADNRCWNFMPTGDDRLTPLRRTLDAISENGRCYMQFEGLTCYALFSGQVLVKLSPMALDAGGRVSPILLLFDIFSEHREQALARLPGQLQRMSRRLSPVVEAQLSILNLRLARPKLLFLLSLLFCRKAKVE